MQVRFYDIRWNMADEDSEETRTPEACGLPSECVLELEEDLDLANDAADVLSQEYGWLVDGCCYVIMQQKEAGEAGQMEHNILRHYKTIRVPLEISFTTDPAELADHRCGPAPTKESLVAWLKDALVLQVDTEGYGQPAGAVFAASGIDWNAATLTEEQDASCQ